MGRYLGPKERLSRRAGVDLGLKGERRLLGKGALERRGQLVPGQHGRRMVRRTSVYGEQLLEKQKARWCYGLREKQFRRLAKEAIRSQAIAGDQLLVILESRLDNVVYRLGLAGTRAQARQFVNHNHVLVDGKKVNIASFRVKEGQTVQVRDKAKAIQERAAAALADVHRVPAWLEVNGDDLSGRVLRMPTLDEIDTPVNVQLIIEFYSRG
jgi:small subunit ribosomal protein S4